VAWWIWALGLAAAASRTTNPILLGLTLAVLGFVVANRRSEAPWARAFKYYLYLGLVVVAIRVVFRSVLGGDIDAATMHVWFRLPRIPLPSWAAGVQLGGPVTAEGTFSALYDAMTLAVILACIGAANVLANPKRALRSLPGALYELGVAVVVTLSVAPQLVESVQRVRRARKLRGGTGAGAHALRQVAIPVLHDALERSLRLAAAMDSRGYGRTGPASARTRHLTAGLMLAGMGGLCLGAFGLLDASTSRQVGFPAVVVGSVLCVTGLVLGGRRVSRSRYRPDPWAGPEWVVVLVGLLPLVVFWSGLGVSEAGLNPSTVPLVWPSVPLVPVLSLLVAGSAAVVAPPPPHPARRRSGRLAPAAPVGAARVEERAGRLEVPA
jgi:energy-coupling factor transport system permease protein